MRRSAITLSLMSGLVGLVLGVARLDVGRCHPAPATVGVLAPGPERSLLRPRQVRSSHRTRTDQDFETRFAYHLPLAKIEVAIQRYYENGWWRGVRILFERWSAEDPESAFEKAVKMQWPSVKYEKSVARGAHYQSTVVNWSSEVFRVISKNWFQSDPEQALRAYLALAESDETKSGYAEIAIAAYADHDPAEAAQLGLARLDWQGNFRVGNHSAGGRIGQAAAIFGKWAKRDPQQAATAALGSGIEDRGLLAAILRGIYEGWTEGDPEAAESWAAGLDARLPLEEVRSRQIASLAQSEPLEALRMDGEWPGEDNLWAIMNAWAARDGLAVFDAIGDTPQPAEVACRAARALFGKTDTAALGRTILGLSEDLQQRPLTGLAGDWARADPAAAEAFADEIPNPILRRVYLHEVNRIRSDEE